MEMSNEVAEVFMCLEIDSLALCTVFTGGYVGKLNHNRTKCTHYVSITKDIGYEYCTLSSSYEFRIS